MTVPGPPSALAQTYGQPSVLIADDQALVRTGFRLILTEAGIPVVAEAADGAEAVSAVLKYKPDVVLMDIRMPDMDGLEATRRILAARPNSQCRIIMLTIDLDQYVYAALTAGASGYLLKHVTPEYLVSAFRLVRSGDALLSPSITRRLGERFAPAKPVNLPLQADLAVLTPRELEVLRLLAHGRNRAVRARSCRGPTHARGCGTRARVGCSTARPTRRERSAPPEA